MYVVAAARPTALQVAVRVVSSITTEEHVAAGLKDTVNDVMGEPPSEAGYAHEATIEVSVT